MDNITVASCWKEPKREQDWWPLRLGQVRASIFRRAMIDLAAHDCGSLDPWPKDQARVAEKRYTSYIMRNVIGKRSAELSTK
jgi:hypothetical protein